MGGVRVVKMAEWGEGLVQGNSAGRLGTMANAGGEWETISRGKQDFRLSGSRLAYGDLTVLRSLKTGKLRLINSANTCSALSLHLT